MVKKQLAIVQRLGLCLDVRFIALAECIFVNDWLLAHHLASDESRDSLLIITNPFNIFFPTSNLPLKFIKLFSF